MQVNIWRDSVCMQYPLEETDKYSTSHCKVVQMKITFALQILWGNFHAKMITIFNEDP